MALKKTAAGGLIGGALLMYSPPVFGSDEDKNSPDDLTVVSSPLSQARQLSFNVPHYSPLQLSLVRNDVYRHLLHDLPHYNLHLTSSTPSFNYQTPGFRANISFLTDISTQVPGLEGMISLGHNGLPFARTKEGHQFLAAFKRRHGGLVFYLKIQF